MLNQLKTADKGQQGPTSANGQGYTTKTRATDTDADTEPDDGLTVIDNQLSAWCVNVTSGLFVI